MSSQPHQGRFLHMGHSIYRVYLLGDGRAYHYAERTLW